jgi:putative phosphoribosyl transferase
MPAFVDRIDAGERLAQALSDYRETDAVVLALPRGGVVVGSAVARELRLPLRALIVRKLGAPHNPELAIGAVSENGVKWLDYAIVREVGATESYIEREVVAQRAEAERRQREYRGGASLEEVRGRTAIVIDDGIATGATALVGAQSARRLEASQVVLATPVASPQAASALKPFVDRFVALQTPDPFLAVGMHYEYFGQVTDREVVEYLGMSYEL